MTRRVAKAEAVVRWQHPSRGLIDSTDFMPMAQEARLAEEIGAWVFREACAWSTGWQAKRRRVLHVGVKGLSGSPSAFSHADGWLCHVGWSGPQRATEITEIVLLEGGPGERDRALEAQGLSERLSADATGTTLPVRVRMAGYGIDLIKIAPSFDDKLVPGSVHLILIEVVIAIAHRQGIKVMATGVETEAQRDFLAEVGCDFAQGGCFGEALSPEEFERMAVTAS